MPKPLIVLDIRDLRIDDFSKDPEPFLYPQTEELLKKINPNKVAIAVIGEDGRRPGTLIWKVDCAPSGYVKKPLYPETLQRLYPQASLVISYEIVNGTYEINWEDVDATPYNKILLISSNGELRDVCSSQLGWGTAKCYETVELEIHNPLPLQALVPDPTREVRVWLDVDRALFNTEMSFLLQKTILNDAVLKTLLRILFLYPKASSDTSLLTARTEEAKNDNNPFSIHSIGSALIQRGVPLKSIVHTRKFDDQNNKRGIMKIGAIKIIQTRAPKDLTFYFDDLESEIDLALERAKEIPNLVIIHVHQRGDLTSEAIEKFTALCSAQLARGRSSPTLFSADAPALPEPEPEAKTTNDGTSLFSQSTGPG